MAHSVTIASGKTNVALPNGFSYDAGDDVLLSDEEYARLRADLIPSYVIDNGVVADLTGDDVVTQGVAVPAQGALTSSAPSALTSSAPSALTSATISGGESPTEAEHNALQADVAALRTTLAAVRTDASALRTNQAAIQTDLAATRTKLNALIASLTGTGKPLSS